MWEVCGGVVAVGGLAGRGSRKEEDRPEEAGVQPQRRKAPGRRQKPDDIGRRGRGVAGLARRTGGRRSGKAVRGGLIFISDQHAILFLRS